MRELKEKEREVSRPLGSFSLNKNSDTVHQIKNPRFCRHPGVHALEHNTSHRSGKRDKAHDDDLSITYDPLLPFLEKNVFFSTLGLLNATRSRLMAMAAFFYDHPSNVEYD